MLMPMAEQPSRDERIYRNTVRALYLFALVANTLIIWQQVKDTPEGQMAQARLVQLHGKIMRPWRERDYFRRASNQVIFEATEVVEKARGAETNE